MSLALDEYRWLVSEAAARWLAFAASELVGNEPSSAFLSRLRKEVSAARAHLVVEQVELRRRAGLKFSLAERMFFTRKALEQASDEQVARCKAGRFSAGRPVLDLCCGIGGDLLAFAGVTSAVGMDRDPIAALLAEANGRVHGYSGTQCQVMTAEVRQADVSAAHAWHCDPDRRVSGRRTAQVEFGEPSLEQLEELLSGNPNAAIKMAPAAEAPGNWRERAELEWLGSRGECRQQVAWFGGLARHGGQHSATIVDAQGGPRTVVGTPAEFDAVASQLGRYLYEPDAVVLAAKLANVLCQQHELKPISAGIAYLTGDRLVHDSALDVFEILDVLPFDRKKLKAYCREHQIGQLEIKKRGVDVEPSRLRTEVIAKGEEEATLVVAPVLGQVRAIVAWRVVG